MTQQTIPLASDARERLLLAIADTVPPEQIAEIHFFPPIRQGTLETGVAVVAAIAGHAERAEEAARVISAAEDASITGVEGDGSIEGTEVGAPVERPEQSEHARHVVYTARYRWTRKGPERGKWESEVVAEADAPLITVEAVVRGVQHRANETVLPERVSGDDARARITDARCRTTP